MCFQAAEINLSNAKLRDASWQAANLSGEQSDGLNLTEANFKRADLFKVKLFA
ncbi:MAG TPA: hypothetical protein DCY88_35010 [Cyanobacteria bacterium UBA11372]|nr:hypothetical protein [Cyanobacteria bacterium UBA11372]